MGYDEKMLYRRLAELRFKLKIRKRNHATYTYSKPPPGSGGGDQTGKSAKSIKDINFNIDRIAASLVAETEHTNAEKEENIEHQQEKANNETVGSTVETNNHEAYLSHETLTTVESLEKTNSYKNKSIFSKITLPSFTEIDFDYIEISLNRERVKDWHHEVIKKNELEYFGKFVDGERYVSTHGHWKQPIKSCLLDTRTKYSCY